MFIETMRRVAALLLTGLLFAFSCGQAGAMTIYTSEIQSDVQALIDAFQKEHPGTDIKIFRSGSGEVEAKAASRKWRPETSKLTRCGSPIRRSSNTLRATSSCGAPRYRSPATRPSTLYQNGTYHDEVRLLYNVMVVNTRKLGSIPPTQELDGCS